MNQHGVEQAMHENMHLVRREDGINNTSEGWPHSGRKLHREENTGNPQNQPQNKPGTRTQFTSKN
jgi:hypothetical protein